MHRPDCDRRDGPHSTIPHPRHTEKVINETVARAVEYRLLDCSRGCASSASSPPAEGVECGPITGSKCPMGAVFAVTRMGGADGAPSKHGPAKHRWSFRGLRRSGESPTTAARREFLEEPGWCEEWRSLGELFCRRNRAAADPSSWREARRVSAPHLEHRSNGNGLLSLDEVARRARGTFATRHARRGRAGAGGVGERSVPSLDRLRAGAPRICRDRCRTRRPFSDQNARDLRSRRKSAPRFEALYRARHARLRRDSGSRARRANRRHAANRADGIYRSGNGRVRAFSFANWACSDARASFMLWVTA